MKLLVIGGNAAGMSAAARVKRKNPNAQVIVLEKTQDVSYGACGLPYYIAGLNDDMNLIRIRTAAEFEASGIEVRLGSGVTGIEYETKTVEYVQDGQTKKETYDKLLIASGSSAKTPPIPGIEKGNIFPLKTPRHAEELRAALIENPGNVVIIGGGYIGLELAEAALLRKAKSLRIIEALPRLLNVFDPEFGDAVRQELQRQGAAVHLGERVQRFEGDAAVSGVVTDKGTYEADLVILAIGVDPNTGFAGNIEKLPNGAIVTNRAMETSQKDVYAAGDCATAWHRLLEKPAYIALGTNANKQGRLAGDAILGKQVCFDRALGTSMLRCMELELAKTGLGEEDAKVAGIACKFCTVKTRSHARYYPDVTELTIKLCYREEDHVILGAQIMGAKEAVQRINIFALAIDRGMTTQELGFVDLGYAPPFSSVWDAVHIAANACK